MRLRLRTGKYQHRRRATGQQAPVPSSARAAPAGLQHPKIRVAIVAFGALAQGPPVGGAPIGAQAHEPLAGGQSPGSPLKVLPMDQSTARTRFHERLRVRFADTDAQGHVFFANYLTYFDEALSGYLVALGLPFSALKEHGYDLVYRHSQCEHVGRSFFGDELEVDARPERIGNTSITWGFAVYRDAGREIVARGALTCVTLDGATTIKARVPERLRAAIADFEPAPVDGL